MRSGPGADAMPDERLAGLAGQAGSGRPACFTPTRFAEVKALARRPPPVQACRYRGGAAENPVGHLQHPRLYPCSPVLAGSGPKMS